MDGGTPPFQGPGVFDMVCPVAGNRCAAIQTTGCQGKDRVRLAPSGAACVATPPFHGPGVTSIICRGCIAALSAVLSPVVDARDACLVSATTAAGEPLCGSVDAPPLRIKEPSRVLHGPRFRVPPPKNPPTTPRAEGCSSGTPGAAESPHTPAGHPGTSDGHPSPAGPTWGAQRGFRGRFEGLAGAEHGEALCAHGAPALAGTTVPVTAE
eukprot:TRINITY_DN34417_c0_g1_i1.p2 TRINITY_DN34417_c0_g1~~TRINITY_DN34417_c0_g1_i1.p2  ORF type:complete len:210 (-),score=7.41 TRINITY_DN34417_c0_g1_i1:763-1392(-)